MNIFANFFCAKTPKVHNKKGVIYNVSNPHVYLWTEWRKQEQGMGENAIFPISIVPDSAMR
jgi:hypothetical protein